MEVAVFLKIIGYFKALTIDKPVSVGGHGVYSFSLVTWVIIDWAIPPLWRLTTSPLLEIDRSASLLEVVSLYVLQ